MAFDYRQFLAENKLTKVSKGRETGKAQILSEGLHISEGHRCPECGQDPCVCECDDLEMMEANDGTVNIEQLVASQKWPHLLRSYGLKGLAAFYNISEKELRDLTEKYWNKEVGKFRSSLEDLYESGTNKQKEDYLKRKEREAEGNWKGSVGAFVETHGEELGKVATSRQTLIDYIENVMKPELNDEAKGYVDNLVATVKSPYKLLMSLYNATLKGSGLGLNEEDDMSEENLMEMAMNHASLGGERHRKKPGVKPGSAGQDKMAKSEMKGEKLDVTLNGITKSVSKQAYSRFRKMTDPEEKKAWKKKYGFIK